MGGLGSGQRPGRTRKRTVDECLTLSMNQLMRDRLVGSDRHEGGTLHWTRTATGEEVASVAYGLHTRGQGPLCLVLQYRVPPRTRTSLVGCG